MHILASTHLKTLYHSLIEPYRNYCCIVWASPERSTILEVRHKLQKRAIRIILYANYRAHSEVLFKRLNIFNIYDLCRLQILICVYKSCNNILPSKYSNYFACTKEIHSYSTCSTVHANLHIINAKNHFKPVVLMHLSQKLQGIGIHYLYK